jgi:hypothetical protein
MLTGFCVRTTRQIWIISSSQIFHNAPNLLDLLSKANAPFGTVYLDVWQRHLTALDDDYIREKALADLDTATRLKTVWQVRMLPVQNPDPKECAKLEERSNLQAKIDKLQSAQKTAKPKPKPRWGKLLPRQRSLRSCAKNCKARQRLPPFAARSNVSRRFPNGTHSSRRAAAC